jgi:hypothetical protein
MASPLLTLPSVFTSERKFVASAACPVACARLQGVAGVHGAVAVRVADEEADAHRRVGHDLRGYVCDALQNDGCPLRICDAGQFDGYRLARECGRPSDTAAAAGDAGGAARERIIEREDKV